MAQRIPGFFSPPGFIGAGDLAENFASQLDFAGLLQCIEFSPLMQLRHLGTESLQADSEIGMVDRILIF